MKNDLKTCKYCLLDNTMNGVSVDDQGSCNFCKDHTPFVPFGEKKLVKVFEAAAKKKRAYDALVPLSGGKDSTYVLYLAVKKYKLRVLTYTYDNGFLSDMARTNINTVINKCQVDHIWIRHDPGMIRELYRTSLVESGEFCGICGVGIERSMLKISRGWKIPIILLGHSPTETNSFTTEDIYDPKRLRAILRTNPDITSQMIRRFLIYPRLNYISSYLKTVAGVFGKKINILFYLPIPHENDIGSILKEEMDWEEPENSRYTRHFDCIAEPFSNYVREKRFGSSRRLPQLSNMIRNHELTRDEAMMILAEDRSRALPANYGRIMSELTLTESDVEKIAQIPANVFSKEVSVANRIFAFARGILKKYAH